MTATLATGSKVCPGCRVERPLEDFPRDKSRASGRASRCRVCDNARSKSYYDANRDAVLARIAARPSKVKPRSCTRCGEQTPSGRHHYCDTCRPIARAEKERRRARGRDYRSSTARGYGHRHQQERKKWEPLVMAGGVRCARGSECVYAVDGVAALIEPGSRWDLDHDDDDRSLYIGPSHQRCNRATAPRRSKTSRKW